MWLGGSSDIIIVSYPGAAGERRTRRRFQATGPAARAARRQGSPARGDRASSDRPASRPLDANTLHTRQFEGATGRHLPSQVTSGQAQLEAMRQQRRRQELTETARPLQQPQQQAVGQPRGADDRFLDVLRGAEAAHPANTWDPQRTRPFFAEFLS
ncbi:hypothetical protein WJX74_003492 [Apatococcus lobatus]|uniref:Uncharacterized protein n=1 Tax=Apatococcus lobatus TaxID=904363 RepID=A0AAW1QJI5_9CHLO